MFFQFVYLKSHAVVYNLISSLSLQLWDRPAGRSSLFFIQASLGLVFLVAGLTRVFPLELSDAACFPALDVEGPHPGIVLGENYRQGLPMNHEENPGLLQVSDPCFQEFNSQTVAMFFFYFKLLIKFESIYLPSVLVDLLTCRWSPWSRSLATSGGSTRQQFWQGQSTGSLLSRMDSPIAVRSFH